MYGQDSREQNTSASIRLRLHSISMGIWLVGELTVSCRSAETFSHEKQTSCQVGDRI